MMANLTQTILQKGQPHRPWPYPDRSWVIRQDWIHLAFLHWALDPEQLRPLIPAPLRLDTFEGKAYLGLVPFLMDNVRPRFLPCVPGISHFPELNIRTYVIHDGKPGVLFFSLDATSRIAVELGRRFFHLPYVPARMRVDPNGETTRYSSQRHGYTEGENAFAARLHGPGDVYYAKNGSLDHFLTERYCFYAASAAGSMTCGDIAHAPWPLRKGEAQIEQNSLLKQFSIQESTAPDLVHISSGVQVLGWAPQEIS